MIRGQEFTPLANCHAPGLYSIPLQVNESSVQRMFVDSLGTAHTVAPHSHRYDLTLTVLRGTLAHTVWEPDPWGAIPMYRFEWTPPIPGAQGQFTSMGEPGRFTLKDEEQTRFNVTTELMRETWVRLEAHQFHSLATEPGTVWIVTEQLDKRESETLWFTPEYTPDLTGLYVPMPPPSVVKA